MTLTKVLSELGLLLINKTKLQSTEMPLRTEVWFIQESLALGTTFPKPKSCLGKIPEPSFLILTNILTSPSFFLPEDRLFFLPKVEVYLFSKCFGHTDSLESFRRKQGNTINHTFPQFTVSLRELQPRITGSSKMICRGLFCPCHASSLPSYSPLFPPSLGPV